MDEKRDPQSHPAAPPQDPVAAPGPPSGSPPPPSPSGGHGGVNRGGATFGLILVVIGLVIIADRVVPGIRIWELWPLIIVAVGVKQIFTSKGRETFGPNRVVEGFTTIAVGLIFLGNATGVLPWSLWLSVFSLWPLLLVAAGIEIIGKSLDNSWLRSLSGLLILAGLLYGALVLPAGTFNLGFGIAGPRSEPFAVSEPADPDIDEGEATIAGGVGDISISSGEDLIAAEGSTPFGEPIFDINSRGDQVDAEISLGSEGVWTGYRGEPRLDVVLSEDVAWTLTIDSGVSRLDADLEDLDIRELTIGSGVSEVDVMLGKPGMPAGKVPIHVSSGVSTVRVRIPSDVEFRVSSAAGISIVDVDGSGGFTLGERTYESDGWGGARRGYEIDVSSGLANVEIDIY